MNVNDTLLAVAGVLGGGSGGGGEAVLINKTVTANGTYTATDDEADGYKKVVVNVPTPTPALTPKTITENGTYLPQDDGADGFDTVTVDVAGGPTYTEISAITIRNDSSNGYNNTILFNPTVAIKKFDIKYKLITGNVIDSNDIVLAQVSYYGTYGISPTTPFFSYRSSDGVSSIVKSVDANRYAHATGTFDTAIFGAFVGIGAWRDSTYSKTNAFAYVKLYDESDNLVFDAIPVEDGYNRPALYDKVTKQLYYTFTGVGMESGEAVS